MLRQQLPVYSPLSLPALLAGMASASFGPDPRDRLEEALRRSLRAPDVLLCGSGTEALTLALLAAMRARGSDLVALPAFACFDVASAAVAAGARVVFYDVEPRTLAPDWSSLEAALRAGAGVVVAAHLYGVPVPWEPLHRLTEAHGAIAVEDAAQGHGGAWRGGALGTFGALSVMSFGRGKGWTGGRGGALLARLPDGEFHRAPLDPVAPAKQMRLLATTAVQWALGRPALYGLPASLPWLGLGETRYHEAPPPGEISRAAAAWLLATRAAADAEADHRRRTAARLLARLAKLPGVSAIEVLDAATPGYLRLPVRLPGGLRAFPDRARALQLGIAPSYPLALPYLPQIRGLAASAGPRAWPGADELARSLVTLPTHSLLTPRQESEIASLLAPYKHNFPAAGPGTTNR
jgi:dTDP-4-amino-4,6-dideoxygalactose transaminase